VADFSRVLAGPFATMLLGDLGADVIKVERPGVGDDTRAWGPPYVEGESAYYLAITRSANGPTSVGGEIFSSVLSTDVVGPDPTMGGGSPITGWDGNVYASSDFDLTAYDITLTGTSIPEPATWALIATGMVLVIFRVFFSEVIFLLNSLIPIIASYRHCEERAKRVSRRRVRAPHHEVGPHASRRVAARQAEATRRASTCAATLLSMRHHAATAIRRICRAGSRGCRPAA